VKKAAKLGMHAVISLSLGGNIGAHDGTDPFELALDAIVEAGTPVVVAAGNQARDNAHIRGQLSQGSNATFQVQVQQTTVDLQIDVWYSPRIRSTRRSQHQMGSITVLQQFLEEL
jgi:subtilisin family serine protease